MKKKIILVGIFLIILVGILMGLKKSDGNLTGSTLVTFVGKSNPTPTPSQTQVPIQAPKTFQFNSNTDLRMELNRVNPDVLDSDFE